MRLGIISDLHVDTNHRDGDPVEAALHRVLADAGLDVLLIAGDIADNHEVGLAVIRRIEETGCRVLFVPGNHDLWNIDFPGISHTDEIVARLKTHPGCLVDNPVELTEDYVVIGDSGWYDYSYGYGRFSDAYYDKGLHPGKEWKDNYYVNFGMSHIEKTDDTVRRLQAQLKRYPNRKIIFVTHMVSHEGFLLTPEEQSWDFINGYIGSSKYRQILTDQVETVVMAHVHFRRNLRDGGVDYVCRCLGTRRSWKTEAAETEIRDALQILEL